LGLATTKLRQRVKFGARLREREVLR